MQTYANTAADAISRAQAATSCGWVVDLRQDGGGNAFPMIAAVSPLLTQGRLVSFIDRAAHATWITLDGSTVSYQKHLPDGGVQLTVNVPASSSLDQPVAVLQGPLTASSGEATLLAFVGQKNVRTFGETTAGLASGNVGKTMSDGATLILTTGWDSNRNGVKTYPHGINPDVKTTSDVATDTAATAWLTQQCGRS